MSPTEVPTINPVNNAASDIMAFDSDDSDEDEDITSPVLGQAPADMRLQVEDMSVEEASSGELQAVMCWTMVKMK